jgi:hypothetical protein
MLRRVFAFFFLLTLAAAPARADEAFRIYDARGVRAIFDITNSGMGWPSRTSPRLATGSSSSIPPRPPISPARPARRTECSGTPTIGRTGVALMRLLIKEKLDSFFFVTADYAFGASLEA